MNIKMMNEIKSQGHPCSGCPYVFTRGGTDCIMGAVPGDCAWYFYREYVKRQSKAEEKLERGIDMLLEVAELKYGRQYAQSLKKKMRGGTD